MCMCVSVYGERIRWSIIGINIYTVTAIRSIRNYIFSLLWKAPLWLFIITIIITIIIIINLIITPFYTPRLNVRMGEIFRFFFSYVDVMNIPLCKMKHLILL